MRDGRAAEVLVTAAAACTQTRGKELVWQRQQRLLTASSQGQQQQQQQQQQEEVCASNVLSLLDHVS